MTQFPRKSTQPMNAQSFRKAAKRLHEMAEDLEACADKPEPKRAAGAVLAGIRRYVNHLIERIKL